MQRFFYLLSSLVSIYATLCFIRIILTWIPNIAYSSVGRFFSTLCDPYMNLFSKLPFRIGMMDFSPMISIGLLTLVSSVLSGIASTGRLLLGGVFAQLIQLCWGIVQTLIFIFLVMALVRYIVILVSRKSTYQSSAWIQLDNILSPIVFKVIKPFTQGRSIGYKNALLISILSMGFMLVAGNILIGILVILCSRMPI